MRKDSAAVATTFALFACSVLSSSAFGQEPPPVPVPMPYQLPVQVVVQAPPSSLVIPMGTYITVDIADPLSSDQSHPGDAFTAVLHQPIVVDGWVVARAGQPVIGRVVSTQKSGRTKGKSGIAIELGELVLVDGQQLPIRTQEIQNDARSSEGRDLAAVAASAAVGAIIGAGVDGGTGAALGATIGGGAGVVGVLATPGEPARIHPEQVLAFRLDDPVTITTSFSQHAFLAVTAVDYRSVTAPRLRVAEPVLHAAPVPSVIYVDRYPHRSRRY